MQNENKKFYPSKETDAEADSINQNVKLKSFQENHNFARIKCLQN